MIKYIIYFDKGFLNFAGRLGIYRIIARHNYKFATSLLPQLTENDDNIGFSRHWYVRRGTSGRNVCRSTEIFISTGSSQSREILQ